MLRCLRCSERRALPVDPGAAAASDCSMDVNEASAVRGAVSVPVVVELDGNPLLYLAEGALAGMLNQNLDGVSCGLPADDSKVCPVRHRIHNSAGPSKSS